MRQSVLGPQKIVLTFGSLFAGVGGLDLGFERSGMECKWQCEIDDYASRVLMKHWPDVPKHRDIRSLLIGESMCFAEGSHVPIFHTLERDKELTEAKADCGRSLLGSFARYDPDTSLWKTSQRCFLEEWVEFSGTWPRAGTMRNGNAYRLPPLVPRISGTGCLSSGIGIPTATSTDGRRGGETLEAKRRRGSHVGVTLNDYVKRFPTPTARDWRSGKASEATHSRNSRPLSEVIGGQLNPTWVEWLMGFPLGWTDCEDSEMQLCHKSQNGSDEG